MLKKNEFANEAAFNPFQSEKQGTGNSTNEFLVDGIRHIHLMKFVENDNYGVPDKKNRAFSHDYSTVSSNTSLSKLIRINFDGPTNSFPEEHYLTICGLKRVNFHITLTAKNWTVLVLRRIGNNPPVLVASQNGGGMESVNLPAYLIGKAHRLSVEIVATPDVEIFTASWTAPAPKKMPKLGISITTYNKQKFLRANIEKIMDSEPGRNGLIELLIVNNGDDIGSVPDGVHILTLPNVGGAGGFLEGFRHFKEAGHSKFVIMDDDIVIGDDFINRLYAIACLSKNGHHIGSIAELLNTDQRIIKEQGGDIIPEHVFGLHLRNHLLDIAGHDMHNLFAYVPTTFSGWWTLIVDLSVSPSIEASLFIKRDDIAFGLDSSCQGVKTIVFPNLLIAHSEEGSPAYYYYDIRNDLVMRARHRNGLSISTKQLLNLAMHNFLSLRLDRQRMFNMALKDFIAGPRAMRKKSVGKTLSKVRKLAAKPITMQVSKTLEKREGNYVKTKTAIISFFRPKSYRNCNDIPLIDAYPISNCCGIGKYYEPIPFTDKMYVRERRFYSIFVMMFSVFLALKFKILEKIVINSYNKA